MKCIDCGRSRRQYHITNLCSLCRHSTESLGAEGREAANVCTNCTILIFQSPEEAEALGINFYPHINQAHGKKCTGCNTGDIAALSRPYPQQTTFSVSMRYTFA